ncbi:microtubule-associated protein Jupiter isoform X2 [Folsomia candida]|uniref:microtubule-associated protein Jupiter isoform X2 n=1 Tax=Folsomia candida TaxID=158441 RepID=UPI000B8F5946|nr:microtubule-associated protein Jupiter isoform X2 [Folsomia candida]
MNANRRVQVQPPGGECHDIFGSDDFVALETVPHHRITRPPGGESSDIFGSSPTNTPPTTPRKVKNYMASSIFGSTEGQQVKARVRPDGDSFNRLFGAKEGGDVTDSPKKDHQKSNIIFKEGGKVNGHAATIGVVVPNGDAGLIGATNGISVANGTNGHTVATNGVVVPSNGHYHGGSGSTGSLSGPSSGSSTPNGSINGDYKSNGNGSTNGGMPVTPSRRIPPGGYSTKLW